MLLCWLTVLAKIVVGCDVYFVALWWWFSRWFSNIHVEHERCHSLLFCFDRHCGGMWENAVSPMSLGPRCKTHVLTVPCPLARILFIWCIFWALHCMLLTADHFLCACNSSVNSVVYKFLWYIFHCLQNTTHCGIWQKLVIMLADGLTIALKC